METDEFFTIKEKDLLFSLYRKLLQLSGETLQKGDCKKLKTHLVNTIQNNRIQRDIFGLNPVIKDMQTAVIVAEESVLLSWGSCCTTPCAAALAPLWKWSKCMARMWQASSGD